MTPAVYRNPRYEQRMDLHEKHLHSLFSMVSELSAVIGMLRAVLSSEFTQHVPDRREEKVH